MFFNRFIIVVCFTIIRVSVFSQQDINYKFGNVTAKDFDILQYKSVDSNADAVILYQSGSTHFVGNNEWSFNYVYTYTRRIKIINKNAFSLATIKIDVHAKDDDDVNKMLYDVKAVTYNLNNGSVIATQLDKKSIFLSRTDKNNVEEKFTLPAVEQGSIIEYTYTITSDDIFNIPSWYFQSPYYPVIWSECNVSIPATYNYVFLKQGFDSFYIKNIWQTKAKYMLTSKQGRNVYVYATNNNGRWVERNVPPFKMEDYVFSLNNYVDEMEFQLSSIYNGEDRDSIMNTWTRAAEQLLNEDDFQQAVSYNNTWIVNNINAGDDALTIAKRIYKNVQVNYNCIDTTDLFRYESLQDVYTRHVGNTRGINLLLIAMLNHSGIEARPVLLSTRDHGLVKADYPLIQKFNYLICETTINDQKILLDATNPLLAFGELPLKCYNGYARVIDKNESDSLYLSPDSLKETEVETLLLNSNNNGEISGIYKHIMNGVQSLDMRKSFKNTNADNYFKDFKNTSPFELDINHTSIDSLDKPGEPVVVTCNVAFKLNGNIIYFNPMFLSDVFRKNPFAADSRFYPVELPYCLDKIYTLNMQIPSGYKIDELPKSARISLNDNEGMFEYLIQQNNGIIQMACHLKLNKTTFAPDDYINLRNFFSLIVEKESERIVFKKLQ